MQPSENELLILWKEYPKESDSWVQYAEVTPQVIRYRQHRLITNNAYLLDHLIHQLHQLVIPYKTV